MRELTFFTTSTTKLAHARYLAERYPIRVQGFRQRTYHADYVEPRLRSRTEILEGSYKSALGQLTKAGYSEASHPFILEDTSVRIDALSREGEEIPGVDIKHWMQDQTFERLNDQLLAAGNLRDATVRSDVLLHVPSSLRAAWGVNETYIVFTGEQKGTIVEEVTQFEPNLVYPWLDNVSFNKWFRPHGCDAPLGSLPIEIADEVDFRRKAFEKLFQFLKQRHFFASFPAKQLSLQLERKPNFVLCGYPCAGKTTASQHLARSFGYLHVEASDFMHLSYLYRHGYRGPVPIGDFAESALRQKPTIAAERVVEYISQNLDDPVVISGFRAPEEIAYLEKEMAFYGKEFLVRFITADELVRFNRLRLRARPGDAANVDEFRHRDLQQTRMGLGNIKNMAHSKNISNNGALADFLNEFDRYISDEEAHDIDVATAITSIALLTDMSLQEAILITLLSVWDSSESRKFFTTTEIAGLIAAVFPAMHPKHKDNVSRYFNQDFYAFFEISSAASSAKRRYRLSNTGYGMALRALRSALRDTIAQADAATF